MKLNEDLSAIHAYLCADGYVIKNPDIQKHKYYSIGLRNQNLTLLADFQNRFERVFGIKPKIAHGRARVYSKDVYSMLTKEWNFYSDSWKLPEIKGRCLNLWLRAFFDCEGWVELDGRKNRRIGLDSINKKGLIQVQSSLKLIGINSKIRKIANRSTWRLQIFGKNNIEKFSQEVGFLHQTKKKKLQEIVSSYPNYVWNFPEDKLELQKFVTNIIRTKAKIRKPFIIRVISNKKQNIEKLKSSLFLLFAIESKIYENKSGQGTTYFELSIQKKESARKALINDLLNSESLSIIKEA